MSLKKWLFSALKFTDGFHFYLLKYVNVTMPVE